MGKDHHLSHTGIACLLKSVEKDGFPKHFAKSTQLDARHKVCSQVISTYGKLVEAMPMPLENGTVLVCAIQNPLAALCDAMHNLIGFADIMRQTIKVKGAPSFENPWTLMLYSDEISMNPLKEDRRKTMAMYYSFLEFGLLLQYEEVWFTATVVRSTVLKQVSGGASFMYRQVLSAMFPALRTAGVWTTLKGGAEEEVRLYAKCGGSVADEVALTQVLFSKGHNGLHPCPLCRNVYLHDHDFEDPTGHATVTIMHA